MATERDDQQDLLKTGHFELDHTVHLDSGGYVRLCISADMLLTKGEELNFVLRLIAMVREFDESRGIDLSDTSG